jgi:hypothetical protein
VRAQHAAERLAAVTAAREVIAELDRVRPEGLPGRWSRAILADPRSHQRTKASQGLLAREYREEVHGLLRRRLVRLHSSLNPAGSGSSFSSDWLVSYVDDRLGDQVRAAFKKNADRHFGPLFDQARRSAVAAQLAGIELQARPELEEVDAVATSGWSRESMTRLRSTLVARMARSATLLEETATRLEANAAEILADARSQYEDQSEALELPIEAGLRVADEIARALAARVEEARLRRRMAEGPDYPLYDLFPSLARRIETRARELELRRFRDQVARATSAVEPRELRSRIEADLPRHRRFDESLSRLAGELSPGFARDLVYGYSLPVRDPSRREAFRERLSRALEQDRQLSAALEERVKTVVEPLLREVHRQIAERQVTAHFPEVSSGRFRFSESLLLRLHRQEFSLTTFSECLEIPDLTERGDTLVPEHLLKTTEELVLERTSKLLHEGQRAWKGQLEIVSKQEPGIARALRRGREVRSRPEWESFFIEEVESQWRDTGHPALWRSSARPPDNAPTKYLPLFGYVQDEIRKNVRAHFEPEGGLQTAPEPTRKPSKTPTGPRERPSSDPSPGEPGGGIGRAEDGSERGGGLRWWLPAAGVEGAKKPTWLTWLLLALTLLLLIVAMIRSGPWRTFLSATAWVLAVSIAFLSFWLLGRLVVDVADLPQATAELERILGVPPDSGTSDATVFKLGPISRIVLQRAEPADGDGNRPADGAER